MDFSFSEDQNAVRELAARIFGDLATPERHKEVDASGHGVDRRLWAELAAAGLLGLGLPEAAGGAGLGFLETCLVVEEAGRTAAPVPVVPALVLGGWTLARFASKPLQQRWLPPLAAGDALLTAALGEPGGDPRQPATRAEPDGGGWRLHGTKTAVPAGLEAQALVVPARSDAGVVLALVEGDAPGVRRLPQELTSGSRAAQVELHDVPVAADAVIAGPDGGAEALAALLDHAVTARCVQLSGACQAALQLTAAYTSQRHQFGKAIATFQAVGQRAADAYVDTEAVKLTAWQAAWRLAAGLPAAEAAAIARFWADEGAQRVVHACVHLHGGVGVDRDYPLHRYYLLVKELAVELGGGTGALLRLGDLLAAST